MTTQRQPLAGDDGLGARKASHSQGALCWENFLRGAGKKDMETAVPLEARKPRGRSLSPSALLQVRRHRRAGARHARF